MSVPIMDDPTGLVELGVAAERHGWDGVFLWHHIIGTPDFAVPMSDAWVLLGALAVSTERVLLGTTITAIPRHQPQEVARQTVTIDRLSGGRMVLGVGLGEPPSEYTAIGRTADRAVLAQMLDEGLEVLTGLWSGEPFSHHGRHYSFDGVQFLPPPLHGSRIPVWVSALVPNEQTLGRASRWDGVLLGAVTPEGGMDLVPPDAVADVAARPDAPDDVVVVAPVGTDPALYATTGASWVLYTGWMNELRDLAGAPPPGLDAPPV